MLSEHRKKVRLQDKNHRTLKAALIEPRVPRGLWCIIRDCMRYWISTLTF